MLSWQHYGLYLSLCCSTLGRIIKVSPEVLTYRDWTIKKWGAKQYAKLENHGNLDVHPVTKWFYILRVKLCGEYAWCCQISSSFLFFSTVVFCFGLRCRDLWAGPCQTDAGFCGGSERHFLPSQRWLPLTFSSLPPQSSTPFIVVILCMLAFLLLRKWHSKARGCFVYSDIY